MRDFTIIIPHKNSSVLLERLLLSLPSISAEIVVVDDNSNSEEYSKIERMSLLYDFKLYENEGQYAGGARNTGLKYANGDWIIFADADDYFTNEATELIAKYQASDSDIVFFNVISRYSDSGEEAYRSEHIKMIISKADQEGNVDALRCCYTVPWGKMIKRKLIQDYSIAFDEVIAGNDMMFSVLCGLRAKKVCYDLGELYCVTVTFGSITTTLTEKRFESRFKVTLAVNNLLRKEGYSKYQISVLYFIAKSYQFGVKYVFHVIRECIKNRSNIFIGAQKLLKIGSVLRDRQNYRKR